MKYLVEVRKAKRDEKFLFTENRKNVIVDTVIANNCQIMLPVILAEISETDFSEACKTLNDRIQYFDKQLSMDLIKEAREEYTADKKNLESAISILKHLST